MPEPRTFDLDGLGLPACHRCGAPAVVERDSLGVVHVTWRHERWCRVPDRPDDRERLSAALAGAVVRLHRGGDDA